MMGFFKNDKWLRKNFSKLFWRANMANILRLRSERIYVFDIFIFIEVSFYDCIPWSSVIPVCAIDYNSLRVLNHNISQFHIMSHNNKFELKSYVNDIIWTYIDYLIFIGIPFSAFYFLFWWFDVMTEKNNPI